MSRKNKRFDFTPKKYGIEVVRQKTPAWTFSKSSESPSKNSTAGTTMYSQNTKSNARNNKINVYSTKPETSKGRFRDRMDAPGPGAYSIPSSVGVVAHYYRRNGSRSAARQFTTIS